MKLASRVAGLLVVLGGCGSAVSAEPVQSSTGGVGFKIECWYEEQKCLEEAARNCLAGYVVADESKHYVPWGTTGGGRMLYKKTVDCR